MKIRFTPTARLQCLAALEYICRDDRQAALQFRRHAETALKRLADYPASGRVIPEFPDLPYREVIVPPYRLFFHEKDGDIWIIAVWHGAQLPIEP